MKKVLITGISGFAGSFLKDFLEKQEELEIAGADKSNGLDLTDSKKVEEFIAAANPDFVFHLAALTSPSISFGRPHETFSNNIAAEINLLEGLRKINSQARILIIGSGDEYGRAAEKENPINENQPLRPTNPYAVSKISQDFLALQYCLSYKLNIIRVRPFNHIGPRQKPDFVISAFSKQIAEIEKDDVRNPVILVGNLKAIRDFTDVSDIVKAYWLAINQGVVGEVYNLGSGQGHSIEEILNILLSLSSKKIRIQSDPERFKPVDDPVLICDFSKFQNLTGWQPMVDIKDSLTNILNYWRMQII